MQGEDLAAAERETVTTLYDNAVEMLSAWDQVDVLFQSAQKEADPEKALDILSQARTQRDRYSNLRYSELDEAVASRQGDLEVRVIAELRTASEDARSLANRERHEEARQKLQDIRNRAAVISQPSQALRDELARLQQQLTELVELEADFLQLKEAVAQVDEALQVQPPRVDRARALLEGLTERQRKLPRAVQAQSWLNELQGDTENWALARRAFVDGTWEVVQNACDRVIEKSANENLKEQAQALCARAKALLHFERGRQAADLPEKLLQAEQDFAAVDRLLSTFKTDSDPRLEEPLSTSREKIQRIRELKQQDESIRPQLSKVRSLINKGHQAMVAEQGRSGLEPRSEWVQVREILAPLAGRESTLAADIAQLSADNDTYWREDYLKRIKAARSQNLTAILQQAFALAVALDPANLLWEEEERRLRTQLEIEYRVQLVADLASARQVDWKNIVQQRTRILELARLGFVPGGNDAFSEQRAEDALYDAQVKQVRAEVGDVISRPNDPRAAQSATAHLESIIGQDSFRRNPVLVGMLIDLYHSVGRFDDARRTAREVLGVWEHNHNGSMRPSEIWLGLTNAAELYAVGRYEDALNEIRALLERDDREDDNQIRRASERPAVVEDRAARYTRDPVDTLVRQAAMPKPSVR